VSTESVILVNLFLVRIAIYAYDPTGDFFKSQQTPFISTTKGTAMPLQARTEYGNPSERGVNQAKQRGHSFDFIEDDNEKHWLAGFCVEPKNDTATCCLGFWAPSYLYSRIEWRLKEMRHNRDPTALHRKKGCDSVCWSHCVLTCLGAGCELSRKIETCLIMTDLLKWF
jgi:hypothetical protein